MLASRIARQITSRQMAARLGPYTFSARFMSDLPYHLVVGMPALSPTMEAGTLASWALKEGESFAAGDVIAKIETDKASIDFEAQDDGCVAKLLVPDGTQDIAVGVPIMVTVEDAEDAPAFADYVLPPDAADEPAPAPEPESAVPASLPEPTPAPTPAPAHEPVVAATPTAAAAPEPVVAAAPEPVVAAVVTAPTVGPAWGSTAKVSSPIAKTLAATQQAYVDKYGTTGQLPL